MASSSNSSSCSSSSDLNPNPNLELEIENSIRRAARHTVRSSGWTRVLGNREKLDWSDKYGVLRKTKLKCHWINCPDKTSYNLERLCNHIRSHTKERPFQCLVETCKSRYADSRAYRLHLGDVHGIGIGNGNADSESENEGEDDDESEAESMDFQSSFQSSSSDEENAGLYICRCRREFSTIGGLAQHANFPSCHEEGVGFYTCRCNREFSTIGGIVQHVNQSHPHLG